MPEIAATSPEQINIPEPKVTESGDNKAAKEASALALGLNISEKELDNKINALSRDDQVQNHLHRVIVWFIYLAGLLIAISTVVLVWHYIMPESLLFLSHERLEGLRSFLFTGGVGAGLGALGRSKLKITEKNA